MPTVIETIEISQLQLRYAHTRIRRSQAVLRMADSIQRYGQITPVGVVAEDALNFVLIDGYLRVAALRRCGADTVKARVLAPDLQAALIEVLCQPRRWEAIEQAGIIAELQGQGLSQAKIATLVGKHPSWVSRLLGLLEMLSQEMLDAVYSGKISSWTACRVLVPMARANPEHARQLVAHIHAGASTRDYARFFAHYQKANRKVRDAMVAQPALFLKALDVKADQKQAQTLKDGPEGRWRKDLNIVHHMLVRLVEQVPVVFYPGQKTIEKRVLLTAFDQARKTFATLEETITDEITRDAANRDCPGPAGPVASKDQPNAQDLAKHRAIDSIGPKPRAQGLQKSAGAPDPRDQSAIYPLPGQCGAHRRNFAAQP